MELYVDGESTYKIPYFGFEKGGHKYVWRRATDNTPALTAVVTHKLFKYREYQFRSQTDGWTASLNQRSLFSSLRKQRPLAPVSGFEGSLEELNLIWGFILAYECGSDANR